MLKPHDKYNNTWNFAYPAALCTVFSLGVRICLRPSANTDTSGKYKGQIRKIPGIIVCLLYSGGNLKPIFKVEYIKLLL